MSLRPNVSVNRTFTTSLVGGLGVRISAMLGTAKWGPVNEVVTLNSFSDYLRVFSGETSSGLTGVKGAQLFFQQGGVLKFLRVADGDAAKAEISLLDGSSSNLIDVIAKYEGTAGNEIFVKVSDAGSSKVFYTFQQGDNIEFFTNDGNGYANANEAINNIESSLVDLSLSSGATGTDQVAVVNSVFLEDGNNGDGDITNNIITTALEKFLTEDFNYLLIPGFPDNTLHVTVNGWLSNRSLTEKKASVLITGVSLNESLNSISSRTVSGERTVIVSPGVRTVNRHTGNNENLDGSYLACAIGGLLSSGGVGDSVTNKSLNINGLNLIYNRQEQDRLLEMRVVPVSIVNGLPTVIRGVTRFSDKTSPNFELVIVDIVDEITKVLRTFYNGVISRPNTAVSRRIYASNTDAIFDNLIREGLVEEFLPSQVEIGQSPDSIIVNVQFKPVYSVNFVQLNLVIN